MILNRIKLLVLAGASFIAISCGGNMEYNPGGVEGVKALNAPNNNYYVELASGDGKAVTFSWSASTAEDGGSPLYEVVFFKDAAGTEEVQRVSGGIQTSLSITHKELNKILNTAGVEPDTDGTLYWTVIASRGVTDASTQPTPRMFTAKRMKGFKIAPEVMYLVGSASETGDDLSKARKLRTIKAGEEYEIFTRLSPGTYNITDGNGAGARYFNVNNGIIQENVATPTNNTLSGVYCVKVDLTSSSVTVKEVTNVRYFSCRYTTQPFYMTYQGNGEFKAEGFAPDFTGASWGEDRYLFRGEIGGADTKFGSNNADAAASNSAAKVTHDTFVMPYTANYTYSFRAIAEYKDKNGQLMNAILTLKGELAQYTHTIEYTDFK